MVAINDLSYDQSWPPTIDRTINRGILRPTDSVGCRMGCDLNPRNISIFYSVSEQSIGGTTGRKVGCMTYRASAYDLESQVTRFEHDHRPCCD